MFPLSRARDLSRAGFVFNPIMLFANGEQGAWYDPSDLSTLFKDAAGTIPVTASGDPVGLMLDKSQGLELGPEVAPNNEFTAWADPSVPDGWVKFGTHNASNFVANNNDAVRLVSDGVFTGIVVNDGLVVGKTYEVKFDVVSVSLGTGAVLLGPGTDKIFGTAGSFRFVVKATGTAIEIKRNASACDYTIDNISVRELKGNHASQTTSSFRPTRNDTPVIHIDFDGVDDFHRTVFPDLGTDVTIARAIPGVGAEILTGQTIGAGDYDYSNDHAGLVIVNRALTTAETANLTAYLDAKAGI